MLKMVFKPKGSLAYFQQQNCILKNILLKYFGNWEFLCVKNVLFGCFVVLVAVIYKLHLQESEELLDAGSFCAL